jgi:hypothetical protein
MAVRWTRINKRERCLPNNQPKIYSNRPRPTNMSAMASCVTSVAGLHGCAKLHERWRKALRVLRSLIPSHRELLRSKAVVVGEMLSAVGDDDLAAPSFGGQEAPSAIAWRGSGDIIRCRCIMLARCGLNGRQRIARRPVPPPKCRSCLTARNGVFNRNCYKIPAGRRGRLPQTDLLLLRSKCGIANHPSLISLETLSFKTVIRTLLVGRETARI